MQRTIFNTPVVRYLMRYISLFFLKLSGWKTVGHPPTVPKYVIIVAPHTSNWDLFYGALIALAFNLDARFMAKHQLFQKPFGPLVKWIGGVPIDRSASHHTVDQVIQKFNENDSFVLAIAPEGTRRKVKYWKSGFYHIAEGAHVPILLCFLDYAAKTGGAGPLITPTGDLDHDMETIQSFYRTVSGKYADKTSPLAILHKA
jgi:1-acyl-sn-glycerol-3-phosphate acyltransferase